MNFAKFISKSVLVFLTILFWGTGAALTFIGVNVFIAYQKYGDMLSYMYSILPAIVILSFALLFFIIGIIGAFGIFSDSKCLLGMYFLLLSILLGIQVAGIALTFLYREHVDKYVRSSFDYALKLYGMENSTKLSLNFDYMQFKLQCCGQTNFTDWQQTWWFQDTKGLYGNVPQSCCASYTGIYIASMEQPTPQPGVMRIEKASLSYLGQTHSRFCTATSPQPTSLDNYYVEGCYSKLSRIIQLNLMWIAVAFLVLIVLQFLGLICTCLLILCSRRHKNSQHPPYSNIGMHEDAHLKM